MEVLRCLLEVSILPLFPWFFYAILELFRWCDIFCFSFIYRYIFLQEYQDMWNISLLNLSQQLYISYGGFEMSVRGIDFASINIFPWFFYAILELFRWCDIFFFSFNYRYIFLQEYQDMWNISLLNLIYIYIYAQFCFCK